VHEIDCLIMRQTVWLGNRTGLRGTVCLIIRQSVWHWDRLCAGQGLHGTDWECVHRVTKYDPTQTRLSFHFRPDTSKPARRLSCVNNSHLSRILMQAKYPPMFYILNCKYNLSIYFMKCGLLSDWFMCCRCGKTLWDLSKQWTGIYSAVHSRDTPWCFSHVVKEWHRLSYYRQ